MRVAINGWGRIGRIVFRAALKNDADADIDFVAINTCLLYTSPSPRDRG